MAEEESVEKWDGFFPSVLKLYQEVEEREGGEKKLHHGAFVF